MDLVAAAQFDRIGEYVLAYRAYELFKRPFGLVLHDCPPINAQRLGAHGHMQLLCTSQVAAACGAARSQLRVTVGPCAGAGLLPHRRVHHCLIVPQLIARALKGLSVLPHRRKHELPEAFGIAAAKVRALLYRSVSHGATATALSYTDDVLLPNHSTRMQTTAKKMEVRSMEAPEALTRRPASLQNSSTK
jgi:hypothetical protein